jgi:archaellum component FlaC
MNTPSSDQEQLQRELEDKKKLLEDLEASLPAHSIRPHQIQRIEELEEEIRQLKERLKSGT